MKFFTAFIIFAWLAFPGFSQSSNQERFKTLGDSIARASTGSNNKLASYDDLISDDGNTKNYTVYKRKYDSLSRALHESESRLDFLIRANDRRSSIKKERDNYERLTKQMEQLKSDYNDWLSRTK